MSYWVDGCIIYMEQMEKDWRKVILAIVFSFRHGRLEVTVGNSSGCILLDIQVRKSKKRIP